MRPRWKRLQMPWKRRGGAARTPQRCWGLVIKPCSTRCGSLIWTHHERGGPRRLPWPKTRRRWERVLGTRRSSGRIDNAKDRDACRYRSNFPIAPDVLIQYCRQELKRARLEGTGSAIHSPNGRSGTLIGARHGGSRRMGVMTERRIARRYDLSLPVIIRLSAERVADTQKGKTRDVSTRGVYFVLDQDLEPGSELDITLTLPAEITHGSDVFVRALGKVVRVEKRMEDGSSRMGVAAVIERYDIIRGENGKT